MGEHGAHHEMQVPGRDRLAVHAREMIEHGIAVAALVLPIGFLDFPIMDQRIMRMPAGRESVSEGEFGLLQRRERVFEERTLWHLPYLLGDRAIGGIGVLGGFDGELDAVRVWLEDTQAAVRGTKSVRAQMYFMIAIPDYAAGAVGAGLVAGESDSCEAYALDQRLYVKQFLDRVLFLLEHKHIVPRRKMMRTTRMCWSAAALSGLVLCGCATRPPTRAEYASLPPLDSGWSRVYLSAGKESGIKVWSVHQVGPAYINGQLVGNLAKDEHLVVDVLPGHYEAYCSPEEPDKNFTDKRQFTFAAGETRHLACDMAPKGAGAYFGLIGALASTYLTQTYLTDEPMEPNSRLVAYKKLSPADASVARTP
jgi:hypothetical protein